MQSTAPLKIYSDLYAQQQLAIRQYLSKSYFAYLLSVTPSSLNSTYEEIMKNLWIYHCSDIQELLKLESYTLPYNLVNLKEEILRFYEFGDMEFLLTLDKQELETAIRKAATIKKQCGVYHLTNCYNKS